MFLARLDLLAFGPFRDLSLELAERGLHVVYGGNEAGKSTTLRAITGLLYGIDRRTKDDHVHRKADLRIGGVVCGASGERLQIIRRKGDANTLLDEHGKPIDDSVLLRLLGGVTKETFESAFGLDHVKLREGAKALLDGKGALGESLFDASVGGGGEVQRLVRELEAEADAIYRPRGQALPLNEALKAHAEAEKAVKQKQSLPEAYVKQERALEEASAERTQRAERRAELAKKRSVLEQSRKRVPLERRRALRATELAAFGALSGAAGGAPRVEALTAGLATFERAARDKVGAELDALRAKDRVEEAAARCGVSPSAAASRLDVRSESRVLRLLAERAAIEQKTISSRVEIGRAERELAGASEEPTATEKVDELGEAALVRALEAARALGDAESRHAATTQRLTRRRTELAKRAAALGLSERELDAVAALVLPAEATIDRLSERARDEASMLARHEERLEALEGEALSIERQLAEHEGDFAPPDSRALLDARAARDAAWKTFRAAKRDADAEAFERAVTASDAIADQMIREADRVTTLARLRSSAETVGKQQKRATTERDKARAAAAATLAEVSELVRDLGLPRVLPLTELGALAERHRRVVEEHERLTAEEAEAEAAASAIAHAKGALADALSAVAAPTQAATGLAALVDAAARIVDGASARRLRGEERDKARAKLAAELAERRASLAVDEATLAEVRTSLAELLAPLGLPADASADEVQRTLEALRELETAEAQLSDAERRRESATREAAAFAETVARATSELAPDLAAASPAEAVATLSSRARAAEELRREVALLDTQIAELGDRRELTAEELAVLADPDASLAALEALDGELEEIDRDLSRLDQQIGGVRMSLEAWGLDSGAAEASATAQAELARIRLHTERWCRAKIAAEILRREIERYREENQGPLLGSASTLFARLTRGGFKGVRAAFDDKDQASIRCVRADGTEVEVEGLSEGTRDQLYLALRLASLRRHAEIAGPMPVVLDDVLVHFDDERSRAALVALAELAETMQIVFFTHHERNVDLAREAVPPSLLHVHVLAAPAALPQPAQLST